MEQPACKNLYCLLWFTCEIRTRDTQVSPLLRMSTSFSGEPNGWKGLECWIHHRKTPTARGYPTISLTKLHKSRFNHSSKESWLAKRYTRRIARRSVLVPLLWVGFRVSRKDARKGKERGINTQDTSLLGPKEWHVELLLHQESWLAKRYTRRRGNSQRLHKLSAIESKEARIDVRFWKKRR